MIIAIEGIDGSGKSTVAKRLAEHLGYQLYRFPGSSVYGTRARQMLDDGSYKTDQHVFDALCIADRAHHSYRAQIRNHHQVLDRCEISGAVYGADLDETMLWSHLILLDVSPEVAIERIKERGGEDPPSVEHLQRLADRYKHVVSQRYTYGWEIIDANRDPESVWEDVLMTVELWRLRAGV